MKNNREQSVVDAKALLKIFAKQASPLETGEGQLNILTDSCTGAHYCECHIKGSTLISLGTTDVPLDPDDQSEYRANRDIVSDHAAFEKMKADAKNGRSFSNIVAEYTVDFDEAHPIKIIGGQHRFEAIKEALEADVDEYHGIKLYLLLNIEQRLDVQLISNTNIAISTSLFDRMQETVFGPQLREWCQKTGLLDVGQDFADKRERGGRINVQMARTFITNYYLGKRIDKSKFDTTDTSPVVCPSGSHDTDWDKLKTDHPKLWDDARLLEAAREFAALISAQRFAFSTKMAGSKPKPDFPEKATNNAILSAWAYVAGMLHDNETRRKKHFGLRSASGRDPLNAAVLAKGRHKSDPENYRGLGYRTDAKERGRFVELFYYQAEEGCGISKQAVDVAIAKYHAKQAQLEVIKVKER